ncbi:MAG: TonB family protein [Elusimicrobiota bacterium]|jgi:protein TonB|nr:TonB family protein [Elusimicrobiota bacterium]
MKPALRQKNALYTIDFIGSSSQPARYGVQESANTANTASVKPSQSKQDEPAKPEETKSEIKVPPKSAQAEKQQYSSKEQISKKQKKETKPAPGKKETAKLKEEKIVLSKPSILGDVNSANIDPSLEHTMSDGAETGGNIVRASFTNFPYPWYITQVRNALWKEWSKRMPKKTGLSTLVSFTIDRNGAIYSVLIERSSGNDSYDYAATSSANNSAPYPPLPKDFPRDILTVTVEFKSEN